MPYRVLRRGIKRLFSLWHRLKGDGYFNETQFHTGNQTNVVVKNIMGYQLSITVTRVVYTQHYRNVHAVKKRHCVYRVNAIASHDAPHQLKTVTREEVSFPALLPRIFSEKEQRRQVVRAYVDIIAKRIRHIQP